MSDPTPNSKVQLRAISAVMDGQVLVITVGKDFDSGNIHQDWAQTIQIMHVGPYAGVVFDLSKCGLLSSTFFAGLFQLHLFYTAKGMPLIILRQPDSRMVRNLQTLQMSDLFIIESR